MKKIAILLLAAVASLPAQEKGFISLFNGKDLTGWKVNENPETFTVRDGAIVAKGNRSHAFYMGDVMNHKFKDFELMVDVMTEPGANGGIYILTDYQDKGWPAKGFEVQVNNSFNKDPRRTGSLYQVADVNDIVAKDNVWFTEHIIVKGDTVTIKVDGKEVAKWKQPAEWNGTKDFPARRLDSGTIALQAHDPLSVVHYKNIRIKPL